MGRRPTCPSVQIDRASGAIDGIRHGPACVERLQIGKHHVFLGLSGAGGCEGDVGREDQVGGVKQRVRHIWFILENIERGPGYRSPFQRFGKRLGVNQGAPRHVNNVPARTKRGKNGTVDDMAI